MSRMGSDQAKQERLPKAARYHSWHDGPRIAAALMADGAAGVHAGYDIPQGWLPNQPENDDATVFRYEVPLSGDFAWLPPMLNAPDPDYVWGRGFYTREGLAGRDVHGPEIDQH